MTARLCSRAAGFLRRPLLASAAAAAAWALAPAKRPAHAFAPMPPRDAASDHILRSLVTHESEVDAKRMLKSFTKTMKAQRLSKITPEFLVRLLHECGIDDADLVHDIFQVMDWNKNGLLDPAELAAVLTLFHRTSDERERYKFMFRCADWDGTGLVDKQHFRELFTALLEAKYHLGGVQGDPTSHPEYFEGIGEEQFHGVAQYKANVAVEDVFNFADKDHDGKLTEKDFLFWCDRGDKNVYIIESLLYQALRPLEAPIRYRCLDDREFPKQKTA